MKTIIIILLNSILFFSCTVRKGVYNKTAHLNSADLSVVIANNKKYGKKHHAGYNGVAELYRKIDPELNLFVPYYSGLNLEHIFNGDSLTYSWHIFEPRVSPITLVRLADNKVELQQDRTKNWALKSNLTYELKGNSIDFTYTGIPLENFWEKYGYIGIFIASYINAPEQKGIYFIGRSRNGKGDTTNRWIYHLPQAHGQQACQRPAGSNWDPAFDAGLPVTLASGFSDLEYVYPFFYGLFGDNVLIMMFDNEDKDAEIRFAQSPDGAGPKNPAWDFMYFQKNCKVGQPFSFHARVVLKKFEGKDDVIKTYESWSEKKVIGRIGALK